MGRMKAWRFVSNRIHDKNIPAGVVLWVDVAALSADDAIDGVQAVCGDEVKVGKKRPTLVYDPDYAYADRLVAMGGARVVRTTEEIRDEVFS